MDNNVVPFSKKTDSTDQAPPPVRQFIVLFTGDPTPLLIEGILMISQSFVGVGAPDGTILAVFPFDSLKAIVEVEKDSVAEAPIEPASQ